MQKAADCSSRLGFRFLSCQKEQRPAQTSVSRGIAGPFQSCIAQDEKAASCKLQALHCTVMDCVLPLYLSGGSAYAQS